MNCKIFDDYVKNVRKRMITDKVGNKDAALVIAEDVWKSIVNTRSRNRIDEHPALREAFIQNHIFIERDKDLREYLRDQGIQLTNA